MNTKPICFSYKKYVELREAYKQLLEDNQKLAADNRRLRDKLTNMEIKIRILEEDRPRVAFVCDGRACDNDCWPRNCHHTEDVEHATNFTKIDGKYMEEFR